MTLAQPSTIDFVAHHEIQFQACRGVFDELSRTHSCHALIGQESRPSGAELGVLLDHAAFQPAFNKRNYKWLIHMSHDLADWDVYETEKRVLSEFDLVLVPGRMHRDFARKVLGDVPVFEIGWPKLQSATQPAAADEPTTIIYAPSWVDNREWEELLPALIASGYHILVKNHIYYDFENGAEPPRGSEEMYRKAIASLQDMEAFLARAKPSNVEYLDRRSNLCDLLPRAQVLITDGSSASLEFLSFGLSIETGRFGEGESRPHSSTLTSLVKYIPIHELKQRLAAKAEFRDFVRAGSRDARVSGNPFIFEPPEGASRRAATIVELFLFLAQNGYSIRPRTSGVWSRLLRRRGLRWR